MKDPKKEPANLKWIDAMLSSFSEKELYEVVERVQAHLDQRKSIFRIPVEIFSQKLAPGEALVKYLKENKELDYHEIAEILSRDERGIWSTYRRARQKQSQQFEIEDSKEFIVVTIFADRTFSILEALLLYLHDERKWKMQDIANFLNKSYSTVYTTYRRAVQKKGDNQ